MGVSERAEIRGISIKATAFCFEQCVACLFVNTTALNGAERHVGFVSAVAAMLCAGVCSSSVAVGEDGGDLCGVSFQCSFSI
jgi:hypothetical protein